MLGGFLVFGGGWLLAAASWAAAGAQITADEAVLRSAGVKTDNISLLAFFDKRTLHDADSDAVRKLIRRLGSIYYREREQAQTQLVARGPVILDILRGALHDDDLEIVRRVEKCIAVIQEKDVDIDVPAAAVRLLAARHPAGTVEAMLAYIPFANSPGIADATRDLLAALAKTDGHADPELVAALKDPLPARRAAAGEALCRAKLADQKAAVGKLLADPDPFVRLRVASALVTALDKDAVPTLIELLPRLPLKEAWQAETLLFRIADGNDVPSITIGTDETSRGKCQIAWRAWWAKHAAGVDLGVLHEKKPVHGYTLLVLLDAGTVTELGPDNKIRWLVDDIVFPLDAQMVSGNRFLVAEYGARRVTERNLRGDVLWHKTIADPLVAQRLPNGNTFIATIEGVLEVDRAGNQIFAFDMTGGEKIMKAMKLPTGEVACLTDGLRLVRYDVTGKEIYSYPVPLSMRLSGGRIYFFGNGHVLIPHCMENEVVEYDARGKAVWKVDVDQPVAAVRLPNGNTLVTTMDTRGRVIEFDRAGKVVWTYRPSNRIPSTRIPSNRVTRALRR